MQEKLSKLVFVVIEEIKAKYPQIVPTATAWNARPCWPNFVLRKLPTAKKYEAKIAFCQPFWIWIYIIFLEEQKIFSTKVWQKSEYKNKLLMKKVYCEEI